jgi:hypothetical protein
MLKNPAQYESDTSWTKFTVISRQVSPVSALGVSAGYCQRAMLDELGVIRTQMGSTQ